MSNSLGTLWFGADIDLTALKNKINQGNQSILDALKTNYDPKSYQDMVSKLKSELSKETFEIKVTANAQGLTQSIRQQLSGRNGLSGGIDTLNEKIKDQAIVVNNLRTKLAELQALYKKVTTDPAFTHYDVSSLKNNISRISSELRGEVNMLNNMRAQRDAYVNSTKDTILNLKREGQEHRNASSVALQTARERQRAVRELNSDHLRLNTTLAGGIHVSTQLGSALSSLFAVHAARQFLDNVIEIGGQLEKQRISIGAILGDTIKAAHLFEQIKGLALKSPFGVVELDQYTKQLSAYGFKYNELFDMTKRLADISAGAGQDIGRLTLALGHVRSATYLTGITLRQFSMNNIPMLKMLADYYTEIEGKVVSTAEVQDRISKRKVSYQDVIEQIKRLTDEGGMFYNMQEKISESLAAKYKNLKDAMDIMYGEMAEGSVGDALKKIASVLLEGTRHWKEIANVMAVATVAFTVSRLNIGYNTLAMQSNTTATIKQILAEKQLEAAKLRQASITRSLTLAERTKIATSNILTGADLKQALAEGNLTKEEALRIITLKKLRVQEAAQIVGINGVTEAEVMAALAANRWKMELRGVGVSLKNAFSGVGKSTWYTLGAMVGMEIYTAFNSWVENIEDKAKEMQDLIKSRITDLEKMQKEIDKEGMPKDQKELKARVTEMKQVLANSEAYTKTLDAQLSETKDINKQYTILEEAISSCLEKSQRQLDVQKDVADMIKASSTNMKEWYDWLELVVTNPIGNVFGAAYLGVSKLLGHETAWDKMFDFMFNDDINKNMKQTLDAYKNLRTVIDNAWEYKDAIKEVIEQMKESGEISKEFAEDMTNAPFEEQIQKLATSNYWEMIIAKVSSVKPGFQKFADDLKEASQGVADKWEEIATNDIPRMLREEAERRGISEQELNRWCLSNIEDFRMMLDGILQQLDIKEPSIRKRLRKIALDFVSFGMLSKSENGNFNFLLASIGIDEEKLKKFLEDEELADLDDDSDTYKKGEKKDKELEHAKARFAEIKAFLSEYKKYFETYGREKSISLLDALFPDLRDGNGKFMGNEIVDNYEKVLRNLRDSLESTTDARKKFKTEIDKEVSETKLDRDKEQMDEYVEHVKEFNEKLENQWKLYVDILKKTANRKLASLSFIDGKMWDDASRKMLAEFNRIGNERGVLPINFRWDMNKKEMEDALGKENRDLIDLAQKIQNIIRGNYSNFLKETSDAYNKSLTEQEKLNTLIIQRLELERKIASENSNNPAIKAGLQFQLDAINKQIGKQELVVFQQSSEYLKFFGATLSMANYEVQSVGMSIKNALLKALSEGNISAHEYARTIKDINERMKESSETMRSDFGTFLQGGQEGLLKKRQDNVTARAYDVEEAERKLQEARKNGSLEDIAYAEVQLGLSKSALNDAQNALKITLKQYNALQKMSITLSIITGALDGFKQIASSLSEMFDALGNESLANMFSDMADSIGAISSVLAPADNILQNAMKGNVSGVISSAISAPIDLFTGPITAFAQLHDKQLQREIEASQARQKEMENLTKNLEKALERALGGIYNTRSTDDMIQRLREQTEVKYAWTVPGKKTALNYVSEETKQAVEQAEKTKSYYDASYASLRAQRDEIQHQMNLEEDKKKSDSSMIADYKQQLVEIDDQIKNFALDMAKTLWDIDLKSWAKELSDAIVEAWDNGEDAAEAYTSKVKSLIKTLTKNILAQRVVEMAFKNAKIDDLIASIMKDTKGEIDESNVGQLADALFSVSENVSKTMTGVLDMLEERGYIEKEGGSSGSSAGRSIQGVTESTADLLASYINGIRADVSVNRETLMIYMPQIFAAITSVSTLSQTQVTLQQQIAANTLRNADAADRIYDILHRVSPDGTSIRVK